MGEIRINNILYSTPIQKVTQAEYDALGDAKNTNGVLYAITDGESSSGGGTSKPVELTKAQYEALGDSVLNDNILYAITDGDGLSAKNLAYDDSETQLGVNNVQDAISEQNKNLGGLRFGVDGDGNYGYYGADDSLIPFKKAVVMDTLVHSYDVYGASSSVNYTLEKDYDYIVCYTNQTSGATAPEMYTITPTREKVLANGVNYNGNASASIEIFYDCKKGDVITSAYGQWYLFVVVGFHS